MATSNSICRAQPLLGTIVEVAASGATHCDPQEAIDAAFTAAAQVHRLMSFHNSQSDVSRLNREAFPHAVPVHAWTYEVLEKALTSSPFSWPVRRNSCTLAAELRSAAAQRERS